MTLQDRIKALVEYSGLNVSKFANHVGFKTPQTVRELLKGTTKTLSDAAQYKLLAAFPEINRDWLVAGIGEMVGTKDYKIDEIRVPSPEELAQLDDDLRAGRARWVPVVHIDSVGGIHSGNSILTPEYIERYIPLTDARPGDIAIYQSGDSMSPAIPSGAILQVREVEGWQEYLGYGDVFVLLLADERRITKEIRRYDPDPANYFLCVSYNPNVAPEELPRRFVRRVWKVIKVLIDKGW